MILDKLDLVILKEIIQGNGIEFNYTTISKKLNKHRSTIARWVSEFLEQQIITPPLCFPKGLIYDEYPLFTVVFADLPKKAEAWIKEDPNIYAGFYIIEENYNILLFEYHETILSYQLWRENLVKENMIPPRSSREPSTAYYLSNELIEKHDIKVILSLLKNEYSQKQRHIKINHFEMDYNGFELLALLISGKDTNSSFIRVNENKLANKLGRHRKTIEQHIKKLLENGVIEHPSCYLSNYFAPKNYFMVFSLMEADLHIIEEIKKDFHVPLLYRVSAGKYNFSLISIHKSADELLQWNQRYKEKFIRSQKVSILSPNSIIFLDQLKIAHKIIERRLREK